MYLNINIKFNIFHIDLNKNFSDDAFHHCGGYHRGEHHGGDHGGVHRGGGVIYCGDV
jgi:hypothetical protein